MMEQENKMTKQLEQTREGMRMCLETIAVMLRLMGRMRDSEDLPKIKEILSLTNGGGYMDIAFNERGMNITYRDNMGYLNLQRAKQ